MSGDDQPVITAPWRRSLGPVFEAEAMEGLGGKFAAALLDTGPVSDELRGQDEQTLRPQRLQDMESRGARARLLLTVRQPDSSPSPGTRPRMRTRTRVMPATCAPGHRVDADTMRAVFVRALAEGGDFRGAAREFIQALLAAYLEFDPADEGWEILEVHWIKLWPEGSSEPSATAGGTVNRR